MKLFPDLDAKFISYIIPDQENYPNGGFKFVDTLAEADGVSFLCPKCFESNRGRIGTHRVCCLFKGKVNDNVKPGPGRWNPSGTGLSDLTFIPPGAVSVALSGGCVWHGHISNGEASLD